MPEVHRTPVVWMNVTTMAAWNKPAVGIVRVEEKISRELSKLYGENEFNLCVFQNGEFIPYSGTAPPSDPEELLVAAETQAPRDGNAARQLPKSVAFDLNLRVSRWFLRPQSKGAITTQSMETDASKAGEISKPKALRKKILYGDIILSVGLDWSYPYVNEFQSLKDTMGLKIVTFCHDLIPIMFPQYCGDDVAPYYTDYFTKISWASSLVLCNSNSSRDDYLNFVRRVGAREVDTVVIPLGDNVPDQAYPAHHATGTNAADKDDELSLDVQRAAEHPFILFVSTIERRKNHEALYRAYHLLAAAGHANRLPKLVFVGMAGWGVENLLKDIELDPLTKGLIVQLNHVSDRELSYLYEKAYFCAYPSLYEGWGLPIGEALACGKAVIASAQGSIPEVGGDLVTYLDPWNPQAWADEILALVDDPERVKAREIEVRQRYQTRAWRGTAEVVKEALDRLREQTDVSVTLYPGYDLYTLTGTPCGETMRSTGSGGPLTHGPYHALPPGTYDIEITMDKLEGDAGQTFFALRSARGAQEHAFLRIGFDEREHFGVVARMEQIQLHEQINDYEIYSEVTDNLLTSINKIEIKSRAKSNKLSV